MTEDTNFHEVADAPVGRLDLWLVARWPSLSRARWQKALAAGLITVNGSPARASDSVLAGAIVSGSFPPPQAASPGMHPEKIPLDVLFEDDHLICINKPPGLVVHPATGHRDGTLVNAILHHCSALSSGSHPLRPGIVHRLDKDTSGCILVAKNDETQASLSAQFAARTARKIYLAVVRGRPRTTGGVISGAIARHPYHRQRMTVSNRPGARAAETTWRVLASSDGLSLLECHPKTGRTHQIRVHLKHLGHPVAGDRTYGGGADHPRQLLHAWRLGITHPATGELLSFEAPVPPDFPLHPPAPGVSFRI
jgi:23S rRNA pseudouridine1911/1915/1917 synthase